MSSRKLKVGILIVGGILLFAVGLFLIGSRKQLFSHHYEIYTGFDNTDTISSGANVRVSGMDAGTVDSIDIPSSPSQKFRIRLKVDGKFRHMIREDSVATISTQGMVGNEFVEIKKGTDSSPECQPGCTIKSQEPATISQLMQQGNEIANSIKSTIKDLRGRSDVVMSNITDLTGHADRTIKAVSPDIQRIANNGVRISGDARQLVGGVRQGQGAAGKLLVDPATAKNVTDTVANAKQITENVKGASENADNMVSEVRKQDLPQVHATLGNVQDMTGQLNQAVGTFLAKGNKKETTAEALRDTVQNANQAAGNLGDDTEAIKHNFFLRGFFKRRGFYNLAHMTPNKYEDSDFVKKPAARVWVPAAGLFETAPDGNQQLTKEAPSILDEAMSGLVRYLPNNPVMIEAYSSDGAPDLRYRSSEQRASVVRNYLEKRFRLQSKWLGTIAFEAQPPQRSGKASWNGVCLVLVQSK